MALKKIVLTLADRQILSGVLNRQTEVRVVAARMIRELALRLKITGSTKLVDRLNEEAREAAVSAPTWDDLGDLGAYLERINGELREENEDATPVSLKKHEKELIELVEVTVDSIYLEWIRDRMAEVDWAKVRASMPTGEIREIAIQVTIAQSIAVACAADAIDKAIAWVEEESHE